MGFDPALLYISLITGGIGSVLFIYGKKHERWPHLVAGLALVMYPYLVSTVSMTIVIGVAIIAALWIGVRQGW